ncbi:RNA-binding protein NOB1-like [Saccoglossus kowalevskii]
MASDIAEHVVVDSAAFIKNAQLQDIAKHVYTIQDVVREIRDYETKKRLSIAPYEIIFREPPPDCVRFVTQFAKKTGDYPSLSAVDIRIMALTYQLTKEHVGLDHIKQEPVMQVGLLVQFFTSPFTHLFLHRDDCVKRNNDVYRHLEDID